MDMIRERTSCTVGLRNGIWNVVEWSGFIFGFPLSLQIRMIGI